MTREAFDLEGIDPKLVPAVELVLRIVGGEFEARGEVSGRGDDLDALTVVLNMLAESFQVERAARERAEALLADALDAYDNAPDLFCSCMVGSLVVVKCNATMAHALGRPASEILGRPLTDFVVPGFRAALREALDGLSTYGALSHTEMVLDRGGGATLVTSLAGSVQHASDGAPERLRLVLRDVTVERRLEDQLLHAQRMEAIGRLAGGIAHDFNNLLMVIHSAAAVLAGRAKNRAADMSDIALIQEAADRATGLTRDLLAFSRRDPSHARVVPVDDLVQRAEPILRRLLGEVGELELALDGQGAQIRVDPTRFEQVLVNLVVNARDALGRGGHVRIGTRVVDVADEGKAAHPPLAAGRHVQLTVEDDGAGIAPDVLGRVFEPFFTTKPVGKGTGLGLSTVYGTVRQAGGTIHVDSELDRGTTFTLWIPALTAVPKSAVPPAPTPEGTPKGSIVLLVEDDDRVRSVMSRILGSAGYRVIPASSGPDALRVVDEIGEPPDLVVSDVRMPEMSGPETLKKLRERYPKLPCVFVTGYAHELGDELAGSGASVLEKPFVPAALLTSVRTALGVS